MIPKIVHYCWLSDNPIPENLQRCMNSWQTHLPDYEFRRWDFSRFDKNRSLWVSQAFERKKYAFAADYIRLYAVYHEGGIYMDMDIEVLKSFDPFLQAPLMLAYENNVTRRIEAGCFGAEKAHPYLRACLEYYQHRSFVKEDGSLDMRPLPMIMTAVAETSLPGYQFYTQDYFTAKSQQTGKIVCTPHTVAIHHYSGSWLPAWRRYGRKWILALGGEKMKRWMKQVCMRLSILERSEE